jgi:exodeoxyribonuclease VII small subunit
MAQKKFEDSMKRLEEIVKDLEGGDLSLEESLKVFEEGTKLLKFCSDKLEEVEQKVSILLKENDEKYSLKPFDVEDEEKS